ncbi:uncharacterized protein LOC121753621 [Salvia splendens]|uniref:uncharacterized protein LOC121753621 n=1 Tax=Salvia splendens TaxID=180675 RepID=UPI001C26FC7A|nr:uncharacterized protein LOC121753621 [Salvia splendens]
MCIRELIRVASAAALVVVAMILCSAIPGAGATMFPEVEITLANDGENPVWFMCQMTEKGDSLYELPPNSTYRFNFTHVAFPMRWCYMYIHPGSQGFFWVYTVRSRCTKCFWSIDKHPSLYRNDIGRWERQKLFMPPSFNISNFLLNDTQSAR